MVTTNRQVTDAGAPIMIFIVYPVELFLGVSLEQVYPVH